MVTHPIVYFNKCDLTREFCKPKTLKNPVKIYFRKQYISYKKFRFKQELKDIQIAEMSRII